MPHSQDRTGEVFQFTFKKKKKEMQVFILLFHCISPPGLLPSSAGEGGRGAIRWSCPEPPLPPGYICEPDLLLLRDELKFRVQIINQGLLLSLGRILGAYLYFTLLEVLCAVKHPWVVGQGCHHESNQEPSIWSLQKLFISVGKCLWLFWSMSQVTPCGAWVCRETSGSSHVSSCHLWCAAPSNATFVLEGHISVMWMGLCWKIIVCAAVA